MDYHAQFKDLCQKTRGLLIRRASPFNTPDEMALIEVELFENRYRLCKFRCEEEWTEQDRSFIEAVELTQPAFVVPDEFKHHSFCSCVTDSEKLRNLETARNLTNSVVAAIDINQRMSQPTGRKYFQQRRSSAFRESKAGAVSESDSMAFANARSEMKMRSLLGLEVDRNTTVEQPTVPVQPEQPPRPILKARRVSKPVSTVISPIPPVTTDVSSPVDVNPLAAEPEQDASEVDRFDSNDDGQVAEPSKDALPSLEPTEEVHQKDRKPKRTFTPRIKDDSLDVVKILVEDLEVNCPISSTGSVRRSTSIRWSREIETIKERCSKGWIPTSHLDPWHNPKFKDWKKFDPGKRNEPGFSIFDYCALTLWAP